MPRNGQNEHKKRDKLAISHIRSGITPKFVEQVVVFNKDPGEVLPEEINWCKLRWGINCSQGAENTDIRKYL